MKKVKEVNSPKFPKQLNNLLEEALYNTSLAEACIHELTKIQIVQILENYSSPKH